MKQFEVEKQKLIAELQDVKYVCLTADIWSNKHKSYLGITLHYINEKTMQRKSKVLSCGRFVGAHTGANIISEIQAVVHEFGLDGKVIAVITDNGSNFVRAFKDFGLDIEELIDFVPFDDDLLMDDVGANEINALFSLYENCDLEERNAQVNFSIELNFDHIDENIEINIDEPSLGIHLRCGSHTLNLVASVDAKEALKNVQYQEIHKRAFAKFKSLLLKYNRPKSYAVIQRIFSV